MKEILVIVPCGQRKIWDKHPQKGATPARYVYIGAPFKVNAKYAEAFSKYWVILSAKYGFITPEFKILGPYNITFKKKDTNPVSVETLQDQIRKRGLHNYDTIVGLGGKEYRQVIEKSFAYFNKKVHFPFAGLPIGKAMQATKRAIEAGILIP